MKVVILGAGIGSRLGKSIPKPLVELLNGKTILEYQIEKISKYIKSVNEIMMVVGYKKNLIMERYPQLSFVCNEAYSETNTGKSLLVALNELKEDDVLWMNGDVYFDEQVLVKLMRSSTSCMLVNNERCGAEEVKYTIDSQGFISNVSKEVLKAKGEALGINLIKSSDLSILKKHLALIGNRDYFEKAIENMIIQDKVKVLPISTDGLFCQEIDFIEDLECVKAHLKQG